VSYTRISDNIFDSSLWSDCSYLGACTTKLWLAILRESRTTEGHFRRLTPAKAARIGAIPLEMAADAIERLTSPDPMDSSGVEGGRRLLRDPEGAPTDFIITNWQEYGLQFERASKAARQRRWRAKKAAAKQADVDATVYAPSTERLHVDGGETHIEVREVRKEKSISSDIRRTRETPRYPADSIEYRLSEYLLSLLRRRNPKHRKPNLQRWAHHVGLMIRRDGRDPEDIRRVMDWAQSNDVPDSRSGFCWAHVILSTENLREHFDQLTLKAQTATASTARRFVA
jgi:hypothetical protein